MPSTITVTNTNDSGPGSLRAAITQADQDTTRDTIEFAPGVTGTITLLTALPDLTAATIVDGPGASALTVGRSAAPSTPQFRIFTVDSGAEVTLSGLTIARGLIGGFGGGIDNEGRLTIDACEIRGNTAFQVLVNSPRGPFYEYGYGGGVSNDGTLTLSDSTLDGNSADQIGGGLDNNGSATVINSTFNGNSTRLGGAISNRATMTLDDSTLAGDMATEGGGEYFDSGTTEATGSIFAAATGGDVDSPGGAFTSRGHNLFTDAGVSPAGPSDLTNTEPDLSALGDHGGPTPTLALLAGSPAIDASVPVPGVIADQRGVPRPQGDAPDIGAFELATGTFVRLAPQADTALAGTSETLTATVLDPNLQPIAGVPVTFDVTAGPDAGTSGTTSPAGGLTDANGQVTFTFPNAGGPGTDVIVAQATPTGGPEIDSAESTVLWTTLNVTNTGDSGPGSLRAAIELASTLPGPNEITFSVTGMIPLTSPLPDLPSDLTLNGPGASSLTVSSIPPPGNGGFGIFTVPRGEVVRIFDLTIADGAGADGGGIANRGTLTVSGVTFLDDSANGASSGDDLGGGGLSNTETLTVSDSSFVGDSASDGGAIANTGTLTVEGSTFTGNTVGAGGLGGAIANRGTLTLDDSSFTGNSGGESGGLYNDGTATVTASTFAGNTAGAGGAIFNDGTATVLNATLAGNTGTSTGGAIFNSYAGTLTVADSTISGSLGGNGGLYFQSFADPTGVQVRVTGSIFSGNAGGNLIGAGGTASAAFASGGHNLFSDAPALPLDPTDLTNTDPLLAPLGDYTGPIVTLPSETVQQPPQTMALLPGSPAIDAGVAVPGVTTDERGTPRPQGSAPDIGAFESRGFTLALASGNNQSTQAGSAFGAPLVVAVSSPFGEPVAGGQVTFSAPATGASAGLAGNPATIGPDGRASVTATANGGVGAYTIAAQARGAVSGAAFSLSSAVQNPTLTPTPPAGAGTVGQAQTVTVTLRNGNGTPLAGIPVTFQVTAGPNAGASGKTSPAGGLTDASGRVTFTYTGTGVGADTVVATATIPGLSAPITTTATVTWAAAPAPPAASPPTVVNVQRYGYGDQPTTLVLTFSAPLDPTSAQNVANYRIVTIAGHGRGKARAGRVIRVARAQYDAATRTVAVEPAGRLSLRDTYQLTVVGTAPGGLTGTTGVRLDGSGTGQPGSDAVRTIDRSTLAGSSTAYFHLIRYRWAK